ncbi:MAG: response regulator [bacterium]
MAGKNETKKKPTVLIADDNKQTIDLLKKFFLKAKERGDMVCEVIEAYNGDEAIQMLDIAQPELILCDIGMPGKDGFEVLEHFNKFSSKQNLFCFFCFLSAAEEEKIKAFKGGAMGFLNKKDINYFVITLQIKAWLRLAELERKLAEKLP